MYIYSVKTNMIESYCILDESIDCASILLAGFEILASQK